jgi:hypothetical protein
MLHLLAPLVLALCNLPNLEEEEQGSRTKMKEVSRCGWVDKYVITHRVASVVLSEHMLGLVSKSKLDPG